MADPPSQGTPDERTYWDAVVKIADLVPVHFQPVVEGYTFIRCHIVGPAVVWFDSSVRLTGSALGRHDVGDLVWEIDRTADRNLIGLIAIVDSTFEDCIFEGVGFAGTPEDFLKLIPRND